MLLHNSEYLENIARRQFTGILQFSHHVAYRRECRHKPVQYRNDWTNWSGFWHGGFLPPILYCVVRKLGYLQKLGYFPLKLRTSRTFRHSKLIALSTKLVVVDSRACWRHDRYDSWRVVAVYCKSVHCSPLTPLLRCIVDLLYNLFTELTR